MEIESFLSWDGTPAVRGKLSDGTPAGFAWSEDDNGWFSASPIDLFTTGRSMSAESFARWAPEADLSALPD